MCLECNRAAFVADAALLLQLLLLLLCVLCTVFYFVLFWSLSSNNELQLELRRVFCLHFCFFFLLCLIYRIHLTQLSLSLLTIVIYVAHCSTASIPLSRSLAESNSLYCIPTSCTAAMVRTAFLELSFSLSRSASASVCALLCSSLCWSQWGKHTVGAQWANIYAVVLLLFSFFFSLQLQNCCCCCCFWPFLWLFISLYLRQVQGCAFVALSASTASFIKLLI